MENIDCGIVAGPNSSFLIENLIQISEKLSNNKITWYICEDNTAPPKYKNEANDFSIIKNKENVKFTDPLTSIAGSQGGDRHGMGVDILIKHLKNKEKIILLEPDSFPCCFGWDDIILTKINKKHPIVTFSFTKKIKNDFTEDTTSFNYWHTPITGDLGFIGINPKIFTKLNVTFMKMKYIENDTINEKFEKLGTGRTLPIINKELSEIFELPLNTLLQKEWGWRIAYPLKKNGYTSFKFKLFRYETNSQPYDLLFDDNNKLICIHFHHSRFWKKNDLKQQKIEINNIFSHYNIKNEIQTLFYDNLFKN
jgi:hypothetical protein